MSIVIGILFVVVILLILGSLILSGFVLPIWSIVDCLSSETITKRRKITWTLGLVFFWSLAGLIYSSFFAERKILRNTGRTVIGILGLIALFALGYSPRLKKRDFKINSLITMAAKSKVPVSIKDVIEPTPAVGLPDNTAKGTFLRFARTAKSGDIRQFESFYSESFKKQGEIFGRAAMDKFIRLFMAATPPAPIILEEKVDAQSAWFRGIGTAEIGRTEGTTTLILENGQWKVSESKWDWVKNEKMAESSGQQINIPGYPQKIDDFRKSPSNLSTAQVSIREAAIARNPSDGDSMVARGSPIPVPLEKRNGMGQGVSSQSNAISKTNLSVSPTLIGCMADPDWMVRRDAVVAAGRTGNRKYKTHLAKLLKDPHPHVRTAVKSALKELN